MSRLFSVLLILIHLSLSVQCEASIETFDLIYPGCTDPTALNYDDEATIDNGTCIYSTGPDLMGVELNIIQQWCNTFEHETYSFEFTVTNIGTEDVEYFCINDFLGSGWSCFDGLVNGSVLVEPGDTITVGGSFQIEGGWLDSQMNFMTITSIPDEIITGNNNFSFSMGEGLDCTPLPNECDTIFVNIPVYEIDTLFIELPQDTIIEYIELPQDTVVVYQVDTVITQEYVYITDTLVEYVDVYVVDTLIEYITEFVIDTIFLFETDTLTIIETQLIDCETGVDCGDPPGISECWPWTVYIPNTFTPNSDGINDVWKIVYNLDCWVDVEFQIFNRWGNKIYHGYGEDYNSFPFWDGSVSGGDYYVSDGVYVYTFYGRKEDSPGILEESGYITIFR